MWVLANFHAQPWLARRFKAREPRLLCSFPFAGTPSTKQKKTWRRESTCHEKRRPPLLARSSSRVPHDMHVTPSHANSLGPRRVGPPVVYRPHPLLLARCYQGEVGFSNIQPELLSTHLFDAVRPASRIQNEESSAPSRSAPCVALSGATSRSQVLDVSTPWLPTAQRAIPPHILRPRKGKVASKQGKRTVRQASTRPFSSRLLGH